VVFQRVENSCYLSVDHEVGDSKGLNYNLNDGTFLKIFSDDENFSCQHLGKTKAKSDFLLTWFDNLRLAADQSQLVLKINNANKSLPEKGDKIVSVADYKNFAFPEDSSRQLPKIEVTLFGKEKREMSIAVISFDKEGRPHGIVELTNFSTNDVLSYGFKVENVTGIKCNYVHGEVQGYVVMQTLDKRASFFTVKNGVAHGPAVIIGAVFLLPVSVLFSKF